MRIDKNDGMSSREDNTANPESGQRKPWQTPAVVILDLKDAETGVNSTTDATNTFS